MRTAKDGGPSDTEYNFILNLKKKWENLIYFFYLDKLV